MILAIVIVCALLIATMPLVVVYAANRIFEESFKDALSSLVPPDLLGGANGSS